MIIEFLDEKRRNIFFFYTYIYVWPGKHDDRVNCCVTREK